MELTVTETRKKKIKVEFPLYLKHKNLGIYILFKSENEKSIINYESHITESSEIEHFQSMNDYNISSQEVFEKQYNKTIEYLKSLI